MKAIVTVIGKDQVGIIAGVCTKLAEYQVNVLDISQTVMNDYFTMMMVVDTERCTQPFAHPVRCPGGLRPEPGAQCAHSARGYFQRDA